MLTDVVSVVVARLGIVNNIYRIPDPPGSTDRPDELRAYCAKHIKSAAVCGYGSVRISMIFHPVMNAALRESGAPWKLAKAYSSWFGGDYVIVTLDNT